MNASLDEEIDVLPPEGFSGPPGCILKLDKALYGLVQAAFAWQKHLAEILIDIGCKPLKTDPATYYLREGDEFIIIPTHVDDLFPTTNSKRLLDKVWDKLATKLTMKDLGVVQNALKTRIQIDKKSGVIKFSNTPYIEQIVEKFNMVGCKMAETPAELNKPLTVEYWTKLTEEQQKGNQAKFPVRSGIGCFRWVCQMSRPDVKEACQYLSKWAHQPTPQLWENCKRVIRYLSHTKELGLVMVRPDNWQQEWDNLIRSYVDSDWVA